MDVTGRADLELYHRALEDVNKLFLLINTLSVCHREMVFCKLKQQLSNYDVDSFKSGNHNGTLHKTTIVENRVSSRPKKLTAKAQILFDEARTQMLEEKAKKKNDSFNGVASVMPGTVRPCFVKLVPIHDSSDTLISGQEIISRPIAKLPGMKHVYNDTGGYNAEEDIDNPVWNNQDIINDSPRKRCSSRKNKRSWKMDINNEQKCDKHFKCNKCGKSFSQKGGLDIHLKRHFGVKSFACALCEYKAVCKVEILRHMAKHTGERNHPCKMCGKNFTSDCSLRNHIRNVHERSENSVCAHCSFETHSKDILRRHYLIKHTKDEQFECPVCHEVIKQKGTFMVHMRRHTGERPYQCAVCTKPFRSSSQLAAHKRTHRPGEYSCSVCSRHFKTKHQLSRHRIIHTGEKPYTCHLCSYACNVKANITKHVRAVHKLNSFTFKEPRSTGSSDNSDALQRGHKAADEYLQEHTVKVGEILTVEDLQRQSREQMEYQEKTKLDEFKESSNTAVDLLVPEQTLSTSNGCPSSSVTRLGMCENINDGIGTSSSCLVDTCTSDILSSAVQLLNSSVQDVDGCDSQYKTVNETVSIPVEIGQNMYIIQVVPDQNVSL